MRQILADELADRALPPVEEILQAPDAAAELLKFPRATWPVPRGEWENLVVSVAVAVERTEGTRPYAFHRQAALDLVRQEIRELAAREAAKQERTSP